jgi:hypothetical protein
VIPPCGSASVLAKLGSISAIVSAKNLSGSRTGRNVFLGLKKKREVAELMLSGYLHYLREIDDADVLTGCTGKMLSYQRTNYGSRGNINNDLSVIFIHIDS